MELNATTGTAGVQIDGDLTIYTALDDKTALLGALDDRPAIELDLTQVTECDTAGLQLLILLRQEAQRRALPFHLTAASPAVRALVGLYRLEDYFGIPLA